MHFQVSFQILNKYVSLATQERYIKCKYRHKQAWLTIVLITSIKKRDKLKRLATMQPNSTEAKAEYIQHRNLLTKLLKKAKAIIYYKNLFDKNFYNPKETWKTIKNVTKEIRPTIDSIVLEDGSVVTAEQEVSEAFNK